MKSSKKLTFKIVDTEQQAINLTNIINKEYTRYMRKVHPATYTIFNRIDKNFVVWYRY